MKTERIFISAIIILLPSVLAAPSPPRFSFDSTGSSGSTISSNSYSNDGRVMDEDPSTALNILDRKYGALVSSNPSSTEQLIDNIYAEIQTAKSANDQIKLNRQQMAQMELETSQLEAEVNQENNAYLKQKASQGLLAKHFKPLQPPSSEKQDQINELTQAMVDAKFHILALSGSIKKSMSSAYRLFKQYRA